MYQHVGLIYTNALLFARILPIGALIPGFGVFAHPPAPPRCFQIGNLLFSVSAKGALNIIEKEKVDVLLLDWHMLEMNGLELLKQLKND